MEVCTIQHVSLWENTQVGPPVTRIRCDVDVTPEQHIPALLLQLLALLHKLRVKFALTIISGPLHSPRSRIPVRVLRAVDGVDIEHS